MTQLFNVSINSVLKNVKVCDISKQIDRMYNTASFQLDEEPVDGSDVIINYGDKTFTGFVFKTTQIDSYLYTIECRTHSATLTEPYSPYTEQYDEAETSHDLCALYETQTGIPINITAEEVFFGGSYSRKGTIVQALTNVASTTGAEFWFDDTSVQIQPNKYIDGMGVVIPRTDIFDYVALSKSVYNKGVGFITIRNGGSETSDVISKNLIYAEVNECTGELFAYTNPFGELEYTKGTGSFTQVNIDRSETFSLLDQDMITLDGAISTVSNITLNGSVISDYDFEVGHNVIWFTTLKRGQLIVTYTASAYKSFANITVTPIGRFVSFDLFYLDQILKFQSFLSEGCSNVSSDGYMSCIVPDVMIYPKGFDVTTIGGTPSFKFFNKNVEIIRGVTTVSRDYVAVEEATLEVIDTYYRYTTRYPYSSVEAVESSGVSIPYTLSNDVDGYYINLAVYYPNVKVSYNTDSLLHTIKFTDIPNGEITMVITNDDTNESCEYDILGIDMTDLDQIPCEWDQWIPVDVAGELSMEITDVKGKILTVKKPDNSTHQRTVDTYGILKIWVDMDGEYFIDTTSLKPRTSITLVSNVEGLL